MNRSSRRERTVVVDLAYLLGVVLAVLVVVWVIFTSGAAWGHDAIPTAAKPDGWSYPSSCCAGYDCREEADAAVQETATGYRMRSTGEVIAYNSNRVRQSPDGRFHACWSAAKFDEGRIVCLFAPPRAF